MLKNRKVQLIAFFGLLVCALMVVFSVSSDGAKSKDSFEAESNLFSGYVISIENEEICILENQSEAAVLIDQLLEKAKRYYKSGENFSLLTDVEVSQGKYEKGSFSTFEDAKALLGLNTTLGAPEVTTENGEKITLSISDVYLVEEFSETEYETRYEYTYGVNKSYEKVLSEGEKGTVKRVYESKSINGETVSSILVLENVVSEPADRVVEIGVTPAMQLASSELAYFIKPYDGIISSDYGYRYLGGYEFHTGIDLVAKNGSCYGKTAVAAADGVVVESGYSSSRGNYVIIEHEYGFSTVYMHFAKRLVSKGDKVKAGDPVGLIGATGRVTGAHLHFEIHLNGNRANPENYLSFKK